MSRYNLFSASNREQIVNSIDNLFSLRKYRDPSIKEVKV